MSTVYLRSIQRNGKLQFQNFFTISYFAERCYSIENDYSDPNITLLIYIKINKQHFKNTKPVKCNLGKKLMIVYMIFFNWKVTFSKNVLRQNLMKVY